MWYLNNRDNNHMCRHKDKFMKLDEAIKGNVIFAGYSKAIFKENSIIFIKLKYVVVNLLVMFTTSLQ